MKSISKSVIYTLLSQVPAQFFGVIAGIFITRILGPEGRGVYALFFADISLLSTVLGFSVGTAITFYISNKKITREKTIGISLLFSLITILLSFVMLTIWLNVPVLDVFIPTENNTISFILIFGAFIVINQIDILYASFFQGEQHFRIINKVLIINSLLNVSLYAILFLLDYFGFYSMGINEVLFVALIVMAINTLNWHIHFIKKYTYKLTFKLSWKEDISPFISFMGLDHLASIVTFLNSRLVLWIIAFYMESKFVGLFALAFGITQLLTMLSNPLSQVLFPVLWADDGKKYLSTYIMFSRAHFSMLIVLTIFGIIIAPIIIPFIYGVEFSDSILPLQIMLIPAIFSCQTKIFSGILFANNKVKLYLLASLIGVAIALVLNLSLIGRLGILGAAIATSLSYIATFIFIYLSVLLKTDISTGNLFFLSKNNFKQLISKIPKK